MSVECCDFSPLANRTARRLSRSSRACQRAFRSTSTRSRRNYGVARAATDAHDDIRDVLERASARETAARVAAGAIARQVLTHIETEIASHVFSIGSVALPDHLAMTFEDVIGMRPDAPLRCVDAAIEQRMIAEIDRARDAGDTMGGGFEVIAHNVPARLRSYVKWDRKLDGLLPPAILLIP